jgi:hypothetical protein
MVAQAVPQGKSAGADNFGQNKPNLGRSAPFGKTNPI